MIPDSTATPRRTFLSWLGLSGAAAALPLHFTEPHASGGPDPVTKAWDMSWTKRVNGKYRAVFDSPAIGGAADRGSMWRAQYAEVFGIAPAKLTAVLVIRHSGITAAMNDAYWDEFNLNRPSGRGGNAAAAPAATPADSTAHRALPKGNASRESIEQFMKEGGIVLACNEAFAMIVSRFKGDDARKQAIDHLIPGIILQPSGPFALMRAQDAGCHYMMAS
ncbi:MAG TPA: hypothetical protein VGM77_03930 [Gemmatimonadales bacterium]|jgi:hypothetical protein